MWQNPKKNQVVTKLLNSEYEKAKKINCEKKLLKKTQIVTGVTVTVVTVAVVTVEKVTSLNKKKTWHLDRRWDVLGAAFCNSPDFEWLNIGLLIIK